MKHLELNPDMPVREALNIVEQRALNSSTYHGLKTTLFPTDFWVYQELVFELAPDIIIMSGELCSGTLLALRHMLDTAGGGRLIGVHTGQDIISEDVLSTAETTIFYGSTELHYEKAALSIGDNERVLVVHRSSVFNTPECDSLQLYGTLVTEGSYLIVEKTPGIAYDGFFRAVDAFLLDNQHFIIDRSREPFVITSNPRGYLRRTGAAGVPCVNKKQSAPFTKNVNPCILSCRVRDKSGSVLSEIDDMEEFYVHLECAFTRKIEDPVFCLAIMDETGEIIDYFNSRYAGIETFATGPNETLSITFEVKNSFEKGKIQIAATVVSSDEKEVIDLRENLAILNVTHPFHQKKKCIQMRPLKYIEDCMDIKVRKLIPILQYRLLARSAYAGIKTIKAPFDFWMYQEILNEIKPDVVIEIGNAYGGSTLALAHILDRVGNGRIIGLDHDHDFVPQVVRDHPRITLITGDACNSISSVKELIKAGESVLIIEDSSHAYDNTINVLMTFAPLVTEGSYFIVEDSIFHHGLDSGPLPGPFEAIRTFASGNSEFWIDRDKEAFFITWNPTGYLQRVKGK
ncbi:MAG: CmcI family methyltransferase [Candidatus Xenobiia bacterium LiM19]